MVLGIHLFDDPFDFARFIDHEGGAVDAVVSAAHELFGAPNAVSRGYGMVFVGQQTERKIVLVTEFYVLFCGIRARKK